MEHYKKRLIRCQNFEHQGGKSPGKDDEENENANVSRKTSPPSGVERKAMKQKKIARKRAVCRTKFRHTNMELFKLGASMPTSLCKTKQPYNVCTEKTLQLTCANQARDQKKPEKLLPKEAITELIINSIEGKDFDHPKNKTGTGRHSLPQLVPEMPPPKKVRFNPDPPSKGQESPKSRQAVKRRRKTVIGTETYDDCETEANADVDIVRLSHSDDSLLDNRPSPDVTESIQAGPHQQPSSPSLYNLIASQSSTLLKQNKEDVERKSTEHLLQNGGTSAPGENKIYKNRRSSKTIIAHKDPLVDLGFRTNTTHEKVSRSPCSKNERLHADLPVNLEPPTKEAQRFYQLHRWSDKAMVPVKASPVDLGCRTNNETSGRKLCSENGVSHRKNTPDGGLHTPHEERPRLYFSPNDPTVYQHRSEADINDARILENQPINLSVKPTPVVHVQSHPRGVHTVFPEIEEQLTRLKNSPPKARSHQEKKYDALIKDIIDISKAAMMLPFSVPNLLIMNKNYRELQMYLGKTNVSKKLKFAVTATMNELISYVCYKIFGDPNKIRLRLYTEKLLDANLKRHRAELEGFMHLLVYLGTTDENCFRDFFGWIKFISGAKEITLKNQRERALYPDSMREYQNGTKNFLPALIENQRQNPIPIQTSVPSLSTFHNGMPLPNPHNIMHPINPNFPTSLPNLDPPYPNPKVPTSNPSHTISFPNPNVPASATVPNLQPPTSTSVITSPDSQYLMANANTLTYTNQQFQKPEVSNPHQCLLSLTLRFPSSTTPSNPHQYPTAIVSNQASGSNTTSTSIPRKDRESTMKDAEELNLTIRKATEKTSEAVVTTAKEPVENRITKSVIVKDKSMEITKGDRILNEKPAEDVDNEVILEKIGYSKDERGKVEQSKGIKKVRIELEDLDTSPDFQLFKEILIEEDKSVYKKVLKKLARVKEDTARHASVIMIDDDEDISIRKVSVGPSSIDLTHEKMEPLLIDLTNTSSNTISNKNSNEPARKKIKKNAPLRVFEEILVIDDDESSKMRKKDENHNCIEETDDKSQSGPINSKHKCTTETNGHIAVETEFEEPCQKHIVTSFENINRTNVHKNAMKPTEALSIDERKNIDIPSENGKVTVIRKENYSISQFDTVNPPINKNLDFNKEFSRRNERNVHLEAEVESNCNIDVNPSTNRNTEIQLAKLVQPDNQHQKNDALLRQHQVEPKALTTSRIEERMIPEKHSNQTKETDVSAFVEENPNRDTSISPSKTKGTISTTNKTEKHLSYTKTDYIPLQSVQATETRESTPKMASPEGIPPTVKHQNIEPRRYSIISPPITNPTTRTNGHEAINHKNATDVPEATSQPAPGPPNSPRRRYSLVSPPLNKKVLYDSLRNINLASTSHQGSDQTPILLAPPRLDGLRCPPGLPLPPPWHPWLPIREPHLSRRPSVETISNAGSDYTPEATAFEIRLDSKWYRISRSLYDKIPKGKLRYVRENNAFVRYSDGSQMEQFVENVTEEDAPGGGLRERAGSLGRHGLYLGPVNSGEVIEVEEGVQFSGEAFVSEPESYSEEVSKVERFIPLDFFGFYVYVTGFQIVHGNPPISFHTFLMMHNTNRTTMLLKKYIYNLLRTGIVNFSLSNQEP